MTMLVCPDHPDSSSVGACETCGREVCDMCLEDVDAPDEFECPDCGEYGVAMYDDGYDQTGEEEEVRYEL